MFRLDSSVEANGVCGRYTTGAVAGAHLLLDEGLGRRAKHYLATGEPHVVCEYGEGEFWDREELVELAKHTVQHDHAGDERLAQTGGQGHERVIE